MKSLISWGACFGLLWSPIAASGQDAGVDEDPSPYSSAALIGETAWITPGTPFTVGLQLQLDEGWHSYWVNPGDVGEPILLTWDLPDGFSAGAIQWPYPKKIDAEPLRSYGYADEVTFLIEITPPSDWAADTADLKTTANWLICEDVCLFAEETVGLRTPVRSEAPEPGAHFEDIARARTAIPIENSAWNTSAVAYTNSFALRVTPPAIADADLGGAYFFPSELTVLEHAADQPIHEDDGSFVFALQASDYASGTPDRLRGVLVAAEGRYLDADRTARALAVDAPLQIAQSAPPQNSRALPVLILFALLGGLLLNLMPCVFPILSLKVLGFAQHTAHGGRARLMHGLAFAGGVVGSFLVLAGLLFLLRATGGQIGWGFQLQSPLFIAGMAILFLAIGLNLFGVFELRGFAISQGGQSASAHPVARSCADGALAVLVATPCTAPFMGAALGAAIMLPLAEALLIFVCLGLGMALPYVCLSTMPQLLGKLPRPGPWMETLKQVLAFPMLGTMVWLLWVFGNQVGVNGLGLLLVGLLLLAAAMWILGRWPALTVPLRARLISRSIALLMACVGLFSAYRGAESMGASPAAALSDAAWSPFSIEKVAELDDAGRPVFVDFTAAWCLTCQVNKQTTLTSDAVMSAFRQKNVILMRADWTSRDAEITRALESHGRSGVPLYVLYPGNNAPPVLLPEVLTESIVLNALAPLSNQDGLITTTTS